MLYLISYDVRNDDRAERYQDIDDFFTQAGAARLLYSAWLFVSELPANDIFDRVMKAPLFGENDGLVVMEVTSQTATTNVMIPVSEVTRLLASARG